MLSWILSAEVPALWVPLTVLVALLVRRGRAPAERPDALAAASWGREGPGEPLMGTGPLAEPALRSELKDR